MAVRATKHAIMIRALLSIAALALSVTTASAQTVVLVRHAEKADASSDPVLSSAGEERARALAASLAGSGVDLIIVSSLRRTGLTAAPTASSAGLTPEAVPVDDPAVTHVEAVAGRVRRAEPDDVVLVVGHSNTVPAIARLLGVAGVADLADCEYDRLLVLRLSGDGADAIDSRYGAPSDCGPPPP